MLTKFRLIIYNHVCCLGSTMKSKPQREIIYEKIVQYINNNGGISTGERLTEVELVNQFHVRRTPEREALLHLEKKGALDLPLDSGAVVESVGAGRMDKNLAYLHRLERDMERYA